MSQSEQRSEVHPRADAERRPKKPYHKPTVRYERVFEVQALICGKVETTQWSCHQSRKRS
jgi:hypothetical protein